MNIVLEGNINFYDELHKIDSDDEDDNDNEPLCLLTNLPLDKNSIKLSCNHEFNLLPLYKEVVQQKTHTVSSYLNTDKLAYNQIKCPYCRQKMDYLLPHVRLNKGMGFISGVNAPEKMCMEFHTCKHTFKSGKNKDQYCSKAAYFDVEGCYCSTHHAYILKQKMKKSSKPTTTNTKKPIKISTKKPVCNAILKSGKRAGQVCGSKIKCKNDSFCKRHVSK
jgi:hypothetical protein